MNQDLISIIVTTYRRPEMIVKAIENCLQQTYRNLEIIVVDDNGQGSTFQKQTEKEVSNQISREQIKYVPLLKNLGACGARNEGAAIANGKYISFFDDDDEWSPDKIQLQYEKMMDSSEATGMVLCGQKAVLVKDGSTLYTVSYDSLSEDAYPQLLNQSISFATPNPLIRKSAFLDVGGFTLDLPSAQDLELGLRLLKKYKLATIKHVGLISKVHPGERISTNHLGKIEGLKYILVHYKSDLSHAGEKNYWQRILMHGFYGNLPIPAKEAVQTLRKLGAFEFKFKLFYAGISNKFLRGILKTYLRLNNALY